jgi:Zn finger protein HypA/HybF involved in hydrogenase expression
MHERAAINRAVHLLLEETEEDPVADVLIELGPELTVELVEDAWAQATAGTPAQDADVTFVTHLHELQCFRCGATYEGNKLTRCTSCGGNGLVIRAAPEIHVASWHTEVP